MCTCTTIYIGSCVSILYKNNKNISKNERVCRDIYQNQKKHRNKMALATKLNTTST